MRLRVALGAAVVVNAAPLFAQATPLSRSDAVRSALAQGARLGVARADSLLASAQVALARTRPNPGLSLSYTKSFPTYHALVDIPFDFPGIRSLRIRAAEVGAQAANLRNQFVRASIALDADTTYTQAVAARQRLALSTRNARDADSLLHMVERRQAAGDASDMDVELARVNAGQQANVQVGDSLTLVSSLLDLQAVLGMTDQRLAIAVTDSLAMPAEAATPGTTLSEAAASLSLESATLAARLQRRSIWSSPSLSFGFDTGDPDQKGLLPVFGVGIGLPLFDRNRAGIAQAEAERARAAAELTLAQVEARTEIARAVRERQTAMSRVQRDQALVTSANRVAAMALTGYREGAFSLPNVLEAQRNARDVLAQYIDDLAAAWIATAELRVLALPPASTGKP
jgi:cobalt-zinc-cadmium efflux system outer membrane protein